MSEQFSQRLFTANLLLALLASAILGLGALAVSGAAVWLIARTQYAIILDGFRTADSAFISVSMAVALAIMTALWLAGGMAFHRLWQISQCFRTKGRSGLSHEGGSFMAALFCAVGPLSAIVFVAWKLTPNSGGYDALAITLLQLSGLGVLPALFHLGAELVLRVPDHS